MTVYLFAGFINFFPAEVQGNVERTLISEFVIVQHKSMKLFCLRGRDLFAFTTEIDFNLDVTSPRSTFDTILVFSVSHHRSVSSLLHLWPSLSSFIALSSSLAETGSVDKCILMVQKSEMLAREKNTVFQVCLHSCSFPLPVINLNLCRYEVNHRWYLQLQPDL